MAKKAKPKKPAAKADVESYKHEAAKRKNIPTAENQKLVADEEKATASYYHDEGNWQNRMILGDSLLVMASLAEREGLRGKVQCIYMDPPYGIKFNSNWQPSTKSHEVREGNKDSVTREPEVIRA